MPATRVAELDFREAGLQNLPAALLQELINRITALEGGGGGGSNNRWTDLSLEWTEDFLWQGTLPASGGWDQIQMFNIYGLKFSGTNARIDTNNAATERIGVLEMETGTTSAGYCALITNINACSFGKGTWTYEAVVCPTTMPTGDRSDDFTMVVGFMDTPYQVDQSRGAYFLYNPRNSAVGGANPSNANKWQTVTAFGTLAANKTMTLVNSPTVGAVTWPDTNVQRLKIVGTTTSVAFYINDTLVATHTTNIPPAGPTGFMGAGLGIVNEAGTTNHILNVDYTRLAVTLTSTRTP